MKYTLHLKGKIESALVCDVPGSLMSSAKEQILIHLAGVVGDKHYGVTAPSNSRYPMYPRRTEIRNSRQVSIISAEEMAVVAERLALPEFRPEWIGANLLTSGIPNLTLIPPATRLIFPGGAVLIVQGENDPCTYAGAAVMEVNPGRLEREADFVKAAVHLRGVVAWVEHPGAISRGDEITVDVPEQFDYHALTRKE